MTEPNRESVAALPSLLRPCVRTLARVVCTDAVRDWGLEDAVADHVAWSLASFPPHLRFALTAGLASLEHGARLYPGGRGRPFSRLPEDVRDRYFASLWHSPLFAVRQLAKGLKGLVALAFWDHPDVRQRLKYTPEVWIAEVSARRLASYGPDIAAHERFVIAANPLRSAR